MINRIYHILLCAAASVALTACWQDIDLTYNEEFDPVLCLNADITADQPFVIKLSRTWLVTDSTAYTSDTTLVKNASVAVYFDDKLVARPSYSVFTDSTHSTRRGYLCEQRPVPGTRIRITADAPRYGHVEAETTVPYPAKVGRVTGMILFDRSVENAPWGDTDSDFSWGNQNARIDLYIPVGDSAAQQDWYQFYSNDYKRYELPEVYCNLGWIDYAADKIFAEHIDGYETVMGGSSFGFSIFSDKSFSGGEHKLHIKYPTVTIRPARYKTLEQALGSLTVEVELNSISQSYYGWEMYRWFEQSSIVGDMSGIGLGDMIEPYSNTSTHAGVVTARTKTTVPINLGTLKLTFGTVR